MLADRGGARRRGIAGPARSAVIFGAAVEQRRAAAGAAIDAVALVIDIFAGEGAFGAAFAQHMVGHRVERGVASAIGHGVNSCGAARSRRRRSGPDIGPKRGYRKGGDAGDPRSEEHTSELQSLMRISY